MDRFTALASSGYISQAELGHFGHLAGLGFNTHIKFYITTTIMATNSD